MAHAALGSLLHFLRRYHDHAAAEATDGELLRRHANGDEAAFPTLVRRHAPMVWGVCRRLLDNEADAEDAFQAVFLVLLQKAESLRVPQSLAAFLHGVAYRIAQKAKRTAQRRRHHEAQVESRIVSAPLPAIELSELHALLDEELQRLPEKYRIPLVLCYLEGKSYVETARQLGWRDGTVCGRLARARELLRQRLSRRGLTLSGAALATALAEPASAPATLVTAAARLAAVFGLGQAAVSPAVGTLAQGVLQAMRLAKLKTMAVVVIILCVLAGGAGLAAHRVLAVAERDTTLVLPMPKQSVRQERPRQGKDPEAEMTRPMRSLTGHQDRIRSVACSPDGRWIATASWDGTVRLWEAETGKEVRRLDVPASKWHKPAQLSQILFSPDNQLVVVAQQSAPEEPGVIVWDRRSGERVRDFPGFCAAIAPDGKQIACGGWGTPDPNRGDIRLYELATGTLVRVMHTPYSRIHRLTFAPDGRMLFGLVGIPRPPLGNGMGRLGFDPVQVRAWDAATGKERRTGLEGAGGNVPIAFSPDGRTLALANLLLEIATGGQRVELTGHTQEVEAVAFSSDGRTLATGSTDGTVRLWDLPSGKELARLGKEVPRFAGHGWVLAVAFSPDGRTLVSAGLDRTAFLWDVSRITGRRREPAERSPAELESDWKELSGDATTGYAALSRFISSPKSAVAFLEKQFQSTRPDTKRIARLIADLDDEQFAVREQAAKELKELAEQAASALRHALADKPPLEKRRRLEALLDRLDGAKLAPETVRQIRAVETLEAIGSPEARRLLDKLAAGPAETRLTEEAKAAVERLDRRTSEPRP